MKGQGEEEEEDSGRWEVAGAISTGVEENVSLGKQGNHSLLAKQLVKRWFSAVWADLRQLVRFGLGENS